MTDLRRAVESIVEFDIRPVLKIHGGDLTIISVSDEGEVRLRFEGACRGCALQSVTFALSVRQRLKSLTDASDVTMEGVSVSNAALDRIAQMYDGYSFRMAGHK